MALSSALRIAQKKKSLACELTLLAPCCDEYTMKVEGLEPIITSEALEAYDAAVDRAARVADEPLAAPARPRAPASPPPHSCVVLGTGSPHAARTYGKAGFRHLAGGLDGKKGYNPEDLGEWLMVRCAGAAAGADGFTAEAHYGAALSGEGEGAYEVTALSRDHWAELVVLFNVLEGAQPVPEGGKLAAVGITDGLEAEEKLCALMNTVSSTSCGSDHRAWVARHTSSRRLCAIAVVETRGGGGGAYALPGCEGAARALASALKR